MTNTIHKYHPSQKKGIQVFYNDFYNKNKSSRLFNAVLHQGKRWWTYGVAAIVAHAMTGHGLYHRGGVGLSIFFNNNSSSSSSSSSSNSLPTATYTLIMELALWTAGFGLAWYSWLSHLYMSQVKEMTKKWIDEMDRVYLEPKSNVWIMIDNNGNKATEKGSDQVVLGNKSRILGVAILKCHQMAVTSTNLEEGQIQVAALESKIQLALVENAIQFARQQDIKVITQDHKKNRLDSFF